jgi:NAD(P)-dependent dehydrogenase (short-subunit alcohol dehydrogenase family)
VDQLRGRKALITGAAGGLGGYIARALAAEGVDLALSDLPEAPLDANLQLLEGSGVSVESVAADLGDEAQTQGLLADAEETLGPIDILVNNAGLEFGGPFLERAPEEIEALVRVNLVATMLLTRAALPGMLERGRGRVVTISSEVGLAGLARYAAYAASKGGVIALTKALARELAPRGICVNSVAPGPIEAGMLVRGPSYDEGWLAANVPVGRWGRPEEVAACVALLAGADGGYFAGQVLSPNGGTVI